MPAFGKLPVRFTPGQQELSATEMTNWVKTTRALSHIRFGRGIRGSVGANGVTIALSHQAPKPVFSPFRRARVSDYAFDGTIRTHYRGYLIDASGADIGDEIELFCQRGVLDTEPDIRNYWPRLIVTKDGETFRATGLIVVPVTESVGEPPDEETVQRWYFTGIFAPWCEDEARPGRVADLDKPPVEPFPPGLPIPPDGLVPTEEPFRPPGGPLAPGSDDYEDEPRGCGGGYAG